jgi:hypothetical protein
MWAGAWQAAITNLGTGPFYQLLAMSGLFYHLYNQVTCTRNVVAASFAVVLDLI